MTTGTPVNYPRSRYTYRCRICNFPGTRREAIPGISVPATKLGDYGMRGRPADAEYADEMYEATTVAFVAATSDDPAKLTDSASRFGEKSFRSEMPIRIKTTSGTNDGDYTIAARGVSRGEIRLSSSDSLTTEDAATAGTVTISRIIQTQNISRGCPLCGSLNSRQGD